MSALRSAAGAVASALVLAACVTNTPGTKPILTESAADAHDPTCLTQTGSRIDKGTMCAGHGRSYSNDDIDRTGAITAARALRLLDPSITIQH